MQKRIKAKTPRKGRNFSNQGLAAKVAAVEATVKQTQLPHFKPGDTVKVHTRIQEGSKERIQIFEGVVIARGGVGTNRSFTVRKMSHGTGVEKVFVETSPKVAKLEVVQAGKVRRSKLYYLEKLEGRKARIERDLKGTAAAKKAADELKAAEAAQAKAAEEAKKAAEAAQASEEPKS